MTGGEFANLGGFYAQYHTQSPSAGQYDAIDQYNLLFNLNLKYYAFALDNSAFTLPSFLLNIAIVITTGTTIAINMQIA